MDRATPSDTSPAAQAFQDERYRQLGGSERVAIQFRLGSNARAMTRAGIRARHSDYTNDQLDLALARIILGEALVRRVWPDRQLVEP